MKEAEEADAVSEAQGAPRAPCPARITRRAAYDADARVGASSRPLEALAPSRGALTACALEAVRWDFAEEQGERSWRTQQNSKKKAVVVFPIGGNGGRP